MVYRCGIPVRALHVSGAARPGKELILTAVGIAAAAGLTLLFSDSPEKYCIDYRVIRLTPFVPVMIGGFALCLALYGALKNVKRKGVLSYIGVNSMLFYLFDNLPELLVKKAMGYIGVTNVYIVSLCQLIGILLLTPVIVMFVKYFAWFLFGLKKESWSFDYGKLFRVKKKVYKQQKAPSDERAAAEFSTSSNAGRTHASGIFIYRIF